LITRRVPCRHRFKALEREAANADEQIIKSEGDEEEEWVATHASKHYQHDNNVDASNIPDIDMEDVTQEDNEIKDMDIDDIPGLEDMQMPSDEESEDETNKRLYFPSLDCT